MKPKSSPLLLLTILAAVILASGCTGLDPTTLAKSNSLIQQFLNEHPNAQIKVTHFTAEQAKNIIDQIRSDCDNPYLDEKEFYRVNITDPETNFFAVVWIDWNTKTVECVFKIGTEGKVIEKPKIKPECESHSYYKCDSGNLYWFDSCGNKQEKKEYCQYGCSEKACLGDCKSQAEYRCYGDHVYWFDSCGNKQEKKEYCQYGCENGFCKTSPAEKTCEEAGGYCIWPQGYCGDGICSESDKEQICEEVCPNCPSGAAANCPAGTCTKVCKYICPQDCMAITPSSSGGGGESEGQAICEKKCASPDIKFAAVWTDKETYSTGDVVKFFAKLADNNSEPATPEQGNKVYLFGFSPVSGPLTSSIPISYNYSSGYYEYATSPIPSNVESGTWIFYATAEDNESFTGSENVYVKINPTASAPSASVPTKYKGCIGQCLLRFMVASPPTAIISPSASSASGGAVPAIGALLSIPASTEMVVATETTSTSTIVSYQCREGYTVGKYFCKEGGICCVPKITPPVEEFCGSSTQGPCSSDGDCITSGCGLCQSVQEKLLEPPCVYRDCYNAEKYGMKCKCVAQSVTPTATAAIIGEPSIQGRCKWTPYKPVCGNGICEAGEANPTTSDCPTGAECVLKAGTCPQDCASTACKDSDGGKNYYVKGIVTGNDVDGGSMELNDVCEGKEVHEYFCQEPNPNGNYLERQNYGWVNYPCPYGCKEGACVKETPTCSDSTGTHKSGESWTAPDGCNKCYCQEGGAITCTKMACLCSDSDGGKNYYARGSATSDQTSKTDECAYCTGACLPGEQCPPVSCGAVVEYYCMENTIKSETYVCHNGCSEGACIQQQNQNCTDSDGGRYDYYTKGTITTQQGSFTDFCVSPTLLTENYCDYSYYPLYQGRADSYNCTNGCLDGACIKEPNATKNCTNLCYGNIGTYTLGVNESVKIEGYDFRIASLLTQPPQNELSYWYDGNSGNLGIGDIDLQYYSILGNYFLVNPVFRNQTHAILKIGKCDTACLDYSCGNYCFENNRFYDGKYISWLPDGKRVLCDDYKNEACPNGCSNGVCIQ